MDLAWAKCTRFVKFPPLPKFTIGFRILEDEKGGEAIFGCRQEDRPQPFCMSKITRRASRGMNLAGLSSVGVTEVHLRGDEIPDPLLENFDVGKPAVPFSAPNQFIFAGNSETT